MIVFTSISSNYIPKARVLARSLKRHHPDWKFGILLNDKMPLELANSIEPFDFLFQVRDLDLQVPSVNAWLFKHSVVELCTAVKGAAFLYLFREHGAKKVMYLDPDIVVLDSLAPLDALLDRHSVLVTPHITEPYPTSDFVFLDQEVGLMQHGIYNFGFLAVNDSSEGLRFASWWNERLLRYCYVDLPRGIFTDQRWGDLIPVFFPDAHVVRDKAYNVATWNLKQRAITWDGDGKLFVEGQPMRFYHFSGYDSGLMDQALGLYGAGLDGLMALREWYRNALMDEGQAVFGDRPCHYMLYDDGVPITADDRKLYLQFPALEKVFPNPFLTRPTKSSYRHWLARRQPTHLRIQPDFREFLLRERTGRSGAPQAMD